MITAKEARELGVEIKNAELERVCNDIERSAKAGNSKLYWNNSFKYTQTKQHLIALGFKVTEADQRAMMDGWNYLIEW